MAVLDKKFTYIDLFAGIGGFRLAMENYSDHEARCLYASEIDEYAAKVYEDNFKQKPLGDIRQIDPIKEKLECPDVVCGGFPCQTFSKGGNQAGFKDSRGTLFREIIRIIESCRKGDRPKIIILENVQNLINHDKGETWNTIHYEITNAGYNVIEKPIVVAPKDFGVPQLRNRAIILAVRSDLYSDKIDLTVTRSKQNTTSISTIIENNISESEQTKYSLSLEQLHILDCWEEFMTIIPDDEKVIGFPIWSDEFGKKYDISIYPKWKQNIVSKNRALYLRHKKEIDSWLKKWDIKKNFTPTNRKFEWQAGKKMTSVYDGIIQFRTSGIRVKRPTESPALVAMDHRPIYGPLKRYLTPKEAARLQSFPDSYNFNENDKLIFKQLGNAVNVKVIEELFSLFINYLNSKEE